MNRKAYKWIFGISLAGLILLILFTLFLWAMFNVTGAIFFALLGQKLREGVTLAQFLENFVGSPMFYVYLVDGIALVGSAVMLIVTGSTRKNSEKREE